MVIGGRVIGGSRVLDNWPFENWPVHDWPVHDWPVHDWDVLIRDHFGIHRRVLAQSLYQDLDGPIVTDWFLWLAEIDLFFHVTSVTVPRAQSMGERPTQGDMAHTIRDIWMNNHK